MFELKSSKVLEKLGAALYIHKQLIKSAQKGKEAVEYLQKEGVFKNKKRK